MDELISKEMARRIIDSPRNKEQMLRMLESIPPAQPEIIYCKDCRKHNKRIGDYVEKSDGTYDWIWKDQSCPLAEFRDKAQGHEFDYQFCAYAERREVAT